MARVTPFEGVTKLLRVDVRPLRIRRPAGVSGSVTQSQRAQVVVAAASDQRLGLEAVEGLGMGLFIEGGEVGLETEARVARKREGVRWPRSVGCQLSLRKFGSGSGSRDARCHGTE